MTVVTPVYNVEEYLRRCLDSLAAQTLENIEFIVVNDGSTDTCLSIIEEYARGDARFRVVDKENGGYGTAMNAGLDAARGEYVGILESDDFAEPDLFEKLYAAAHAHKCDLVKCNFWRHDSEVGSYKQENYHARYCNVLFDPADPAWCDAIYPTPAIWSGLYRRAFLEQEKIRFLETPGAAFQDTGFVFKTWAAAKRVFVIHDYLVHYRVNRADSSVQSSGKVYCVCEEWDSIMEFLDSRPERKRTLGAFFQVQRYATYRWNYRRIAPGHRLGFLRRVQKDYLAALEGGELEEGRFAPGVWKRLMRTIDDPAAVVEQDERKSASATPPKVSAIVPVCNAGEHLKELLASLRRQTLRGLEVLFVDDGSTDSSAATLDEFCEGKPRFHVFHKQNGGLCSAHNMGLAFARGTYIVFADADGIVPDDAYERLCKSIEQAGADMAVGAVEEFSLLDKALCPQTECLSTMDDIRACDCGCVFSPALCNKILRRSIIEENHLRFEERPAGADALFLSCYIGHASKVVGCPHLVYRCRELLWFEREAAAGAVDARHAASHPGKDGPAARPLVSICLSDDLDDAAIGLQLGALHAQDFPAFELLMGAGSFERVPAEYADMPNIRVLEKAPCTAHVFAEHAKAPYINFLDARICHGPKSLKTMYKTMLQAGEDFAAFGMAAFDGRKRLSGAASAAAFEEPFCRKAARDAKVNAADFSLCNKLFDKDALLRHADVGLSELAATCYNAFGSFLKCRNFCMVCLEPQESFLAHLPRHEAAKLARLGNEGYARRWERRDKAKRFLARVRRKVARMLSR